MQAAYGWDSGLAPDPRVPGLRYTTVDMLRDSKGPLELERIRQGQAEQLDFEITQEEVEYQKQLLKSPELLKVMQGMRITAINKRLDMTDAMEEMSGTGRDAMVGIMQKNRFMATMGTLFRGDLDHVGLGLVCKAYGCGPPDAREPGGYMQVQWKQFAIDFDEVVPPPPPIPPDPTPEILEAMRSMNEYTNLHAIELTHEFEEYLGGKDKCTSDVMPREKFKQALGVLLGRATSLYPHSHEALNAMCKQYGAGRDDPIKPGYKENVMWKEFALDVHAIQPQPYLASILGARAKSAGVTGDPYNPQLDDLDGDGVSDYTAIVARQS